MQIILTGVKFEIKGGKCDVNQLDQTKVHAPPPRGGPQLWTSTHAHTTLVKPENGQDNITIRT